MFSPIFVSDRKLDFVYNFEDPLDNIAHSYLHYGGCKEDAFCSSKGCSELAKFFLGKYNLFHLKSIAIGKLVVDIYVTEVNLGRHLLLYWKRSVLFMYKENCQLRYLPVFRYQSNF